MSARSLLLRPARPLLLRPARPLPGPLVLRPARTLLLRPLLLPARPLLLRPARPLLLRPARPLPPRPARPLLLRPARPLLLRPARPLLPRSLLLPARAPLLSIPDCTLSSYTLGERTQTTRRQHGRLGQNFWQLHPNGMRNSAGCSRASSCNLLGQPHSLLQENHASLGRQSSNIYFGNNCIVQAMPSSTTEKVCHVVFVPVPNETGHSVRSLQHAKLI